MAASKKPATDELGDSGVYIFDGQINGEEYNPDLRGKQALRVYDRMRRSDATVKAALRAVKLPIKSAEYRVDAAPSDADDKAAATQNEAVRRLVHVSLFEFIDFKKFIGEALTAVEFGFSVFEMVFEPRYVDGQLRLALVKLGFRKQLSVERWTTKDDQPGITQLLSTGQTVSIPLEKLVHIALEQEGDNYEGISQLRSAYKHWSMKEKIERVDVVGIENHALGIAKIKSPVGAKTSDIDKMEAWAKARRANATAHVVLPGDGWDVELMNMQGGSLKDSKPSLDYHDNQILKNVLAQFLNLGSSGASGSRAVSEDHSRLFILGIKEVADLIVFAVQRAAIKTLVDLNFTVDAYPTLAIGNISADKVAEVTTALKVVVDAGLLHPAAADENVVRKMLGFPELALEELEDLFDADKEAKPTKPAGDEDDASTKEAAVAELKALRASVEKALYEPADKAA